MPVRAPAVPPCPGGSRPPGCTTPAPVRPVRTGTRSYRGLPRRAISRDRGSPGQAPATGQAPGITPEVHPGTRSPGLVEGHALGVARRALHADDGPLVELLQVGG